MATNRDLLKEAIADAKAVKHMAIANAKAALEEAFTPQVNALFSAKLREMEEVEAEDYLNEVEEEEEEEESTEEEAPEEESEEEDEDGETKIEDMTEEDLAKLIEDIMLEEFPELAKMRGEEHEASETPEEEKAEHEEGGYEEGEEDEMMEDMDLAELLREIEDDSLEESEINLDELLAEIAAEEGMLDEKYEDEAKSKMMETELRSELAEAYTAIDVLRSELTEINMLNAKLLYTNKIFKSKNLSESQKVKVLSSFDKAVTVKEVKLVYETLNEGLKVKTAPTNNNVGRASKTTLSPTVKKPIIESNEAFKRMQKLAGLI